MHTVYVHTSRAIRSISVSRNALVLALVPSVMVVALRLEATLVYAAQHTQGSTAMQGGTRMAPICAPSIGAVVSFLLSFQLAAEAVPFS